MGKLKTSLSAAILFFFAPACHNSQNQFLDDPFQEKQTQVREVVYRIYENFVSKDVKALEEMHLWSDKFSKFDVMGTDLLDADKTKATEREALSEIIQQYRFDRTKNIENLKVSVFGDTAVASFLLHYDAVLRNGENPKGTLRSTLVFVDTDPKKRGQWRITHEHFSLSPQLTPMGRPKK